MRYTQSNGAWLAQVRGGVANYMLPDGQGSVRALVNSTDAITDTYRYDAYGTQTASTGTTPNPYRHDGQRLDVGTGLYQLRARSYDPSTGRFLSRDTAAVGLTDPAQLNRYVFAQADPADLTDPSGLGPLADTAELDEVAVIATQEEVTTATRVTLGQRLKPLLVQALLLAIPAALVVLALLPDPGTGTGPDAHPAPQPTGGTETATGTPDRGPNWVVRGGTAQPGNLQGNYTQHGRVPVLFGFSVQYQPGVPLNELARAGQFRNGQISFAPDIVLIAAVRAMGYDARLIKSPGRGYHATFAVFKDGVNVHDLPLNVATAISSAFIRGPNPYPAP